MKDSLRVLIVEDSPDDAELVVHELRRAGYEPQSRCVEAPQGMGAALDDGQWDIILCDYAMPGFSAPAALAMLKERGLDIPFIVVSGQIGEDTAVEMMRAGAHDYVMKNNLARLAPAVRRELREAEERRRRKQAEEELQASEERYRAVAEDMPVLICRFLPDGEITYVNEAYCKYFAKTSEELVGSSFLSLIPEADRKTVMADISALAVDSPTQSHEHRVIAPDGEARWQRWTNRALFDDRGQPVTYQSIGEDVTERKEIEEQFRQAQKMEAIGRLAGGVAHDFRNQLTVIKGYGERLARLLGDEEGGRHCTTEILSAVDRSDKLTSQLLAYSRKDALSPRVVRPVDLIGDLAKPLMRMIGEDVRLTASAPESLSNVMVDPGQFHQAMMNLAVNARDAMPDGGELTIEASEILVDEASADIHPGLHVGSYILITTTDSGAGMDAETVSHVFEPFFTTKDVDKGTGLGLPMVYGFVKQSGGYVTVDSKPDRGTTFSIYLPSTTKAASQAGRRTAGDDAIRGEGRVLLVEDEEALRAVLVGALREAGYTVMEAGDAREAVPLGEHFDGKIDVLITDVIMPGMSGAVLAAQLTAKRPEMAVIYMTGYAGDTLARRGLDETNAQLMIKPFSPMDMVRKVHEVLKADAGRS